MIMPPNESITIARDGMYESIHLAYGQTLVIGGHFTQWSIHPLCWRGQREKEKKRLIKANRLEAKVH